MSPAGRFLPKSGTGLFLKTYPALALKHICSTITQPVLCCLIIMQLGAGFVIAAESDDSGLFVEAFSAFQKQDYLSTIERIGVINHLFPDSPLRDVALLLLARSAFKSGDNELAAKTILQFNDEFADNPLRSSVEEELQLLGIRLLRGERLLPTESLSSVALDVRNELAALKNPLPEKSEQDRPAPEGTTVKLSGHDSAHPEISARKTFSGIINTPSEAITVAAGQRGVIPFEVSNPGGADEELLLEVHAPLEFEAFLYIEGRADLNSSPVSIGTAGPVKGSVIFRMPPDRLDGRKSVVTLKLVSAKLRHPVQSRETLVITAAPLIRIIAKPEKPVLVRGERLRYRVTVLNAGSLPARDVSVRVLLPDEVELAGGTAFRQDAACGVIFDIQELDTGKIADFILDAKVRDDSPIGRELLSRVEVTHSRLQTKEIFTSASATVQSIGSERP